RDGFTCRPVFKVDGLIHHRTLRHLFGAPEGDCVSDIDVPSLRLVAPDRQHVVPVAGRIRSGGRLGTTVLPARLPYGRRGGMPVRCLGKPWGHWLVNGRFRSRGGSDGGVPGPLPDDENPDDVVL